MILQADGAVKGLSSLRCLIIPSTYLPLPAVLGYIHTEFECGTNIYTYGTLILGMLPMSNVYQLLALYHDQYIGLGK